MSRYQPVKIYQRIRCKHCGERYDLNKAVRVAEAMDSRIVRCPHCAKQVAISNG